MFIRLRRIGFESYPPQAETIFFRLLMRVERMSYPPTETNFFCKMPYFVYVLKSTSSGKIYIGQTSDLQKRISQHNDPSCRLTLHTKRNPGPWCLAHSEEFCTRGEAMAREKALKSGQGRAWIHGAIL
jgi:putative endonuclease